MTDLTLKVRCSNCRGSKTVAKLGGMIGDCNLCNCTGQMNSDERVKVAEVTAPISADIIKAVADVTAIRIEKSPIDSTASDNVVAVEPKLVKVDGKKAIYKRKTIAS